MSDMLPWALIKSNDLIETLKDILEKIKEISGNKEGWKQRLQVILKKVDVLKITGIALTVFSAMVTAACVTATAYVTAALIDLVVTIGGTVAATCVAVAAIPVATYFIYKKIHSGVELVGRIKDTFF